MQIEPKYIIVDEKYTLSIIKKNKEFNEKKTFGITIFKKNLELHILNEDSINIMLKNKKYIYSFANLGIVLLSGIINFAFVTIQDVELAGFLCLSKIYKIKNINFIIIDPDMKESTKNVIQELNKEFINSQIKNGLYFSENTLNIELSYDDFYHHFNFNNPYYYHINKSIGSCYNFDYLQYFNDYSLMDLTSCLISGFFYQKAIKKQKKGEFNMNLIIRNKNLKEKEDEQYNLDEIEIVFLSSNLDKMFHFIFYIFYGDYLLNEHIIHYILKENVPKDKKEKGSVIIFDIIDKINEKLNQERDKYLEELKSKLIKDFIEDNHKFIFIQNKDKISDEIGTNKDLLKEIKFNYEKDGEKKNYQEKQLLLISNKESKESYYFQIIENIFLNLDYEILNKEGENLQKDINSFIIEALISYKNYINSKNEDCIKLYNIKPKSLNKDFINKYILAKNPEMKINNLDKKLSNEDNQIIIGKEEKENSKNESINSINKITKEIFIYIVTYNVNNFNIGSNENIDSLVSQLIFPKELHSFFENNGFPLFYCIGLQEIVELNTSNIVLFSGKNNANLWEIKISQILQDKYNYILQHKENLVGVLLLFFVKASEAKYITNTKKSIKKSGFMNQFGNKGSLFYEFIYKNKSFSFCTGHLCAGNNIKKYNERVNELTGILNHANDKSSNKFFKSDYFFIFGDLNFRVNNIDGKLFFEQVDEINSGLLLASDKKYKKIELNKERSERIKSENIILNTNLLDEKDDNEKKDKNKKERKISEKLFQIYFSDEFYNNDELTNLKSVFEKYNLKENKITFLPTYKYYKGINYYNATTRLPAYTDRILFKNTKEIKCLIYNNIELNYSDHKPIYSLLQIEI